VGLSMENSDFGNHQLVAGREQLTGTSVAVGPERTRLEAGWRQMNGLRVTVLIARDLAKDPVTPTSSGQGDGRAQLRLREIREGERNEDYPAG
jgi:hypothetical protein